VNYMLKASGSILFLAIGLVLLVMGIAIIVYPAYNQWQYNAQQQPPVREALPATFASPTPLVEATATPDPLYATAIAGSGAHKHSQASLPELWGAYLDENSQHQG
jgi:hypothetical protein